MAVTNLRVAVTQRVQQDGMPGLGGQRIGRAVIGDCPSAVWCRPACWLWRCVRTRADQFPELAVGSSWLEPIL